MKQFIYVFSKEAKASLLKAGYVLLKEDDGRLLYVFKNEPNGNSEVKFELTDTAYVLSDMLTF